MGPNMVPTWTFSGSVQEGSHTGPGEPSGGFPEGLLGHSPGLAYLLRPVQGRAGQGRPGQARARAMHGRTGTQAFFCSHFCRRLVAFLFALRCVCPTLDVHSLALYECRRLEDPNHDD